jgi:hypothetical protein
MARADMLHRETYKKCQTFRAIDLEVASEGQDYVNLHRAWRNA